MSMDAAVSGKDTPSVKPATVFRWKIGLGVLALGTVAELGVWNLAPDRTYQVFFSMPVLSATALLTALWWLFLSGLSWNARGAGLVVVGAGVGAFLATYRFEGFDGDMFPRFSLRSTPTREEKLQEFLKSSGASSGNAAAASSKPGGETRSVESSTSADSGSSSATETSKAVASGEASNKPAEEAVVGNAAAASSEPLLITDTDWPGYRGADRDGVVKGVPADIDWNSPPKEIWRHPIGAGWSSFAVVGGLAFTQEQRGDRECVVCYEAETGRQIWEHADAVRFEEPLGGVGPRATPTVDGSRVFSMGATGILNCLDARSGKKLWSKALLDETGTKNLEWAMAGSPLVVGELVIVNPGGPSEKAVRALNRETGADVWSAGSDPASYCAPRLVTLLETSQVLIFDGKGLAGHGLKDGRQLWKHPWENDPKVNAAIPMVLDDRSIVIASGYGLGSTRLRLSRSENKWSVDVEWKSRSFRLKFNPAVCDGDFAWALDEGILGCLNLKDGTQSWKKGRYGYGQLLLAGKTLVVQSEAGDVAFVAADSEKLHELVRFPALADKTWNLPVIWHDLLLVRNSAEAVGFRLARKAP